MASSLASQRHCLAQRALFVVSFVAYVFTATGGAFWLDSSELAAAGVTLGVPHAPGHPLYVMLAHLASWIPLGAVGFRVALLSALSAALCVWLVADLAHRLSAHVLDEEPPWWCASVVALVLAMSQAIWLQAARAEVYTLHLLLALWLTRLAVVWVLSPPPRPRHTLWLAAFAVGLGAGNHHLLLAAHLPALLLLLIAGREAHTGGLRRWAGALAAGLWGLCVYALLPLRAATDPLINYGDPRTAGRLWDMVTAQVFQSSVTEAHAPVGDNLGVAAGMVLDAVGPLIMVLAPLGLVVLWRRNRLVATAVALGIVGNLATKVLMVLDSSNPDAAGYFQMTMALASILAGIALASFARSRWSWAPVAGALAAGLAVLWSAGFAAMASSRLDLSGDDTPAATDMWLLRRAPPDALWLTANTFVHFNRLYQQAVEGYRPDLLVVHQGFEDHIDGGRPLVDVLARRDPRLEPVLDSFLQEGRFPSRAVVAHRSVRPVCLEPTVGLPVPVEDLAYAGGYLCLGAPGQAPDATSAAQGRDELLLRQTWGEAIKGRREARTIHALLWLQLAVVRLQQGLAAPAKSALAHVEALVPKSPYTERLAPIASALGDASETGDPEILARVRSRIAGIDFSQLFQ